MILFFDRGEAKGRVPLEKWDEEKKTAKTPTWEGEYAGTWKRSPMVVLEKEGIKRTSK